MPETPDKPRIGPIGEQVVANIKALMAARKLSIRALGERLDEVGVHMVPSVLGRLMQGNRRVDADDLLALALALGVNPNALLLPRNVRPDDIIELAPNVRQRAGVTWAWADGRHPLPAELTGEGVNVIVTPGDKFIDFVQNSRPADAPATDPAVGELIVLRQMLEDVLNDRDEVRRWEQSRDAILRRFRLAAIQLEELFTRLDRDSLTAAGFEFDSAGAVEQLHAMVAGVREAAVPLAPGTAKRYALQARQDRAAGPHGAATSRVDPLDPFGGKGDG